MDIAFHGIPIAQTMLNLLIYLYIIDKYNIELFVEIGVMRGGLANIILHRAQLPGWRGLHYLGVELNMAEVDPLVMKRVTQLAAKHGNADMLFGDAYKEPALSVITSRIQAPGRALVLCDGGDKVRELLLYTPALKANDIIIAHDYQPQTSEWQRCEQTLLAAGGCELFLPETVKPPGNLAFRKLADG